MSHYQFGVRRKGVCSSIGPELEKVRGQIAAAAKEAGAEAEQDEAYPGWNPDPSSKVLQVGTAAWQLQGLSNSSFIHLQLTGGGDWQQLALQVVMHAAGLKVTPEPFDYEVHPPAATDVRVRPDQQVEELHIMLDQDQLHCTDEPCTSLQCLTMLLTIDAAEAVL